MIPIPDEKPELPIRRKVCEMSAALLLGAACSESSPDRRLLLLLALLALLTLVCCQHASGSSEPSRRQLSRQQRAKSCLGLDGQGLPDLASPSRRKQVNSRARSREGRSKRTKSWMPREAAPPEATLPEEPEPELSKSYSFPLRQRRAQECGPAPYWQTVSYDLAVKFEARRRRRAAHQGPAAPPEALPDKRGCRKGKSASACIGRLRTGFSNLVSRTRGDRPPKAGTTPSPLPGPTDQGMSSSELEAGMPELPQFLGKDRPLVFYPSHLPFDRERFESDVRKKMEELADDRKSKEGARTG